MFYQVSGLFMAPNQGQTGHLAFQANARWAIPFLVQ
jgi:hypothetical protein